MKEENFAELVEDYLDGEYADQLDDKYYEDEKYVDKSQKKVIKRSPFTIEDTITIGKFVNEYLDMRSFGTKQKLYHSGLKEFGDKFAIPVSNEIADRNPELVKHGYLLLVMDARHNRATYINPLFLKQLLEERKAKAILDTMSRMSEQELEEGQKYCNSFYNTALIEETIKTNNEFYNVLVKTNKLGKYRQLLKERIEEDEEY